jgi:hypothetical protein
MADIFQAYRFLNQALGLKLTDAQLARAEAGFRLTFTDREGYNIAKRDIHNWEFFTHLAPRKSFTRPDLGEEARKNPLTVKTTKTGKKG